jgi:hypothetical protein
LGGARALRRELFSLTWLSKCPSNPIAAVRNQYMHYYRYGTWDDCEELQDELSFCTKALTMPAELVKVRHD